VLRFLLPLSISPSFPSPLCSFFCFLVTRSRSPCHVGLNGILIQETQETFKIITFSNHVKTLPKAHNIFSVYVPGEGAPFQIKDLPADTPKINLPASSSSLPTTMSTDNNSTLSPCENFHLVELYGNQMLFRSYERSSRKFKSKATIEL